MDNIDRKQVVDALITTIDHISDKEYQKRAWIKGEAADFDEAICLFFGDGDPVLENYQAYGLSQNQYRLLKRFRDEFRAFSDENFWPPEFIDTPKWAGIMNLAKDVLRAFNYPGLSGN